MTSTDYDTQNIFAKILRGELPAERIAEDAAALAFMDIMPRSDGHVLVIPKAPARNIFDIAPDALAAMQPLVKRIALAARAGMGAEGVTIMMANEKAGGQEVYHLHIHVLPRWLDVPLRGAGIMADKALIAENAAKIRAALS